MDKIRIGIIVSFSKDVDILSKFENAKKMGINTCQLACWDENIMTEFNASMVRKAAESTNMEITAFWCGWPGPKVWNFYGGPLTLGIVPSAFRNERMKTLLKGSYFAQHLGVSDIITHVGFIPENPNDLDYIGTIEVIKFIAQAYKSKGQRFLFETGQETPITIKRVIEDIGLDNLGVNLDPANLLMYGKANPIDALDIIGEFVYGVHAKDGEYPTNGKNLGVEKALGKGRVNFPVLVAKLKQLGYKGALTIEREISGEEQIKDILNAKELLDSII